MPAPENATKARTDHAINKIAFALLHLTPTAMLLLAIGRWPYAYYMLLRVIVLAAGLLLAGLVYQRMKSFNIWIGLFLVVAIVFNPFVPLHLTRGVWEILNVLAAAVFVAHYFVETASPSQLHERD
jgi:hypothetical protein